MATPRNRLAALVVILAVCLAVTIWRPDWLLSGLRRQFGDPWVLPLLITTILVILALAIGETYSMIKSRRSKV